MADPLIRLDVAGGFATITLDSPANRNALSTRLVAELASALRAAGDDPAVRAIVLTHTGSTFCAGADLREASGAGEPAPPSGVRTTGVVTLLRQILEAPKPVIAQIDGHVRAGGMGIVAACDLAVAGPASSFALTEVRLGLAPYMVSLTLLPRLSRRAAERYFLTGERFDAATAAAIGLVTMHADDPEGAVGELCRELAAASPQGLAETKRLTTAELLAGFDRAADDLARRSAALFDSDEGREGMAAFFEKRPPRWAL